MTAPVKINEVKHEINNYDLKKILKNASENFHTEFNKTTGSRRKSTV